MGFAVGGSSLQHGRSSSTLVRGAHFVWYTQQAHLWPTDALSKGCGAGTWGGQEERFQVMTAISCPRSQESQRSPVLVFPDPRQDLPASLCPWNPAVSGCSLLPHCLTLHAPFFRWTLGWHSRLTGIPPHLCHCPVSHRSFH